MRTIDQWLSEYGESHQNRINKILHWLCVPLIVFSLLGLLWSIKSPVIFSSVPFVFNWAVLVVFLVMLYYLFISLKLAFGMLPVIVMLIALLSWIDKLPVSLSLLSLIIFVLAWVGQFIGHRIEGRRPSFFKDLQFLLIGPLWLLSFLYRKLSISY